MNSNYKTISEVKEGIYKEKGSKFLAYISPVTSVKEALDKVEFYKEDQPSARHHCYAYRIGSEGKNSGPTMMENLQEQLVNQS